MEPDHEKKLEAEIELLKRIGQGDDGSLEEFYDRLSGVLFSTAYRVLNNQVAAEDVLQDVFIQIWEKASLYNPALGKPLTWAVTLTRNKAIDRLRSTQRRNRLHDNVQRESEIFDQIRRPKFVRCGRVGGDKQVGAPGDREALDGPAPGDRARVFFVDDPGGNRRASQPTARDDQGPHSTRADEAAGCDQPGIVESAEKRERP